MVWLSGEPSDALNNLTTAIKRELNFTVLSDPKIYCPHITLARIKKSAFGNSIPNRISKRKLHLVEPVETVVVYESVIGRGTKIQRAGIRATRLVLTLKYLLIDNPHSDYPMQIFGITLDDFSCGTLLTRCETWLNMVGFHRIATVNPEFLLRAKEDVAFARNLRLADLGRSTVSASSSSVDSAEKYLPLSGADLMESLLAPGWWEHHPVFSLSVRMDSLRMRNRRRSEKYPALIADGSVVDRRNRASAWNDAHSKIRTSRATIVFSISTPEQEYFTESPGRSGRRTSLAIGGEGL